MSDSATEGRAGVSRGAGRESVVRAIKTTPASFYLPIALFSTWQYAMIKIWNHFCVTPAANFYLSQGVLFLIVGVLLATVPHLRTLSFFEKRPLALSLAVIFCLFPLGVVSFGPFPGVDAIMGVVGSLGALSFCLRCGKLYVGLGFECAIISIFGGLIVSFAVRIAFFLMPDPAVYVLVSTVPFFFEVTYRRASAAKARQGLRFPCARKGGAVRSSKGFLTALALEVIAFSVVSGFFGTPFLVGYSWLHSLILVGIVLVIFSILMSRGPDTRISQLFEVALLCCLFVFVVLTFTTSESALGLLIVNIPHTVLFSLLVLLLVDLENRREFPPMVVFMGGWGIHYLAIGVGRAVSVFVMAVSDLPSSSLIVLAFFLFASVVFVFNKFTNYDKLSSFAEEEPPVKGLIDYSEIERKCDALGAVHGLTKREVEIIRFIAKGRSRGYIAETLVISENTVKGHTRNAYTKLGIHSKQELLTSIESL